MKTRTHKLLIAAAVVLALIGAGLAFYHAYLSPEALRDMVQQTLEAKLHRRVAVKSFEIDLLNRPRVTLGQIDYTSDGAVRIQAESLMARFSLRHLLLGRLEIKDVWLKNPLFTIDVAKFSEQGQMPEMPTIRTEDGRARLLYRGRVLAVDNVKARFGNDRISLEGDIEGGTAALWAMKISRLWRGGAIVHGMPLDELHDGLDGKLDLTLEFKSEKQGYAFTLIGGTRALGLPWGAHVGKSRFTFSGRGDSHTLDVKEIKIESEIMDISGSARLSGIKAGADAVLDLKLGTGEFDYNRMVGLLPTGQFPDWLEELLTRQIRGGRSRFKDFTYQGTIFEMSTWNTCLENMKIIQTINGQSFAFAGPTRVQGVTGTMEISRGTIDFQGLSGTINSSRLKRVDIKFPDFVHRGFRIAVGVDVDMPAADFLLAWRACVVPTGVQSLLDPVANVRGGQVRGDVSIYYENVGDKAVLKGGAALKDVSLTWEGIPIRRLNATGAALDYGDPLDLQTACVWDTTTVESLNARLHDPLGEQRFTYVLKARGLKDWETFRLDQDAPFVLSGDGVWPALKGNLELRSREFTLFENRFGPRNGFITARGLLAAELAPVFTLNIPDLAINLSRDTLQASIDMRGDNSRVKLKGTINLDSLKSSGKDTFAPVDGGVEVLMDMAWGEQDAASGTLVFRQARFAYEDHPVVLSGLVSLNDDTLKTRNLRIRRNRTTADVDGTLGLGKKPSLDADIAIDRLEISASSRGEGAWLKRVTARSRLKLTNCSYYGIPISLGTARAEVGPDGLSLRDIDFSAKAGTVKGSTFLSPEGVLSYQLDLDVKDTPVADFIRAAWPGSPSWMDGAMDLKGRIWGDDKAANGDVVFTARKGRIQRYSLVSKIFSVLNPYKMIKTREIDLLERGFAYNTIMASFQIRDSVVRFNDFYIDSNSVQISAVGQYLIRSHHLDAVLGIEPLETFDKTIHQIPIVGWVLTGEKGSFIVVSLRVRGPIDDVTVKYMPADTITKPVAESLLRILKLPRDLVTKPGEVILPGALREHGQGKP